MSRSGSTSTGAGYGGRSATPPLAQWQQRDDRSGAATPPRPSAYADGAFAANQHQLPSPQQQHFTMSPNGMPEPCASGANCQWRRMLRDEQQRSAKLVAANAVLRETQQYLVEKCSSSAHALTARIQDLERQLAHAQGSGDQLSAAREALDRHAQLNTRLELRTQECGHLRNELHDANETNEELLRQMGQLQDAVEALTGRLESVEEENELLRRRPAPKEAPSSAAKHHHGAGYAYSSGAAVSSPPPLYPPATDGRYRDPSPAEQSAGDWRRASSSSRPTTPVRGHSITVVSPQDRVAASSGTDFSGRRTPPARPAAVALYGSESRYTDPEPAYAHEALYPAHRQNSHTEDRRAFVDDDDNDDDDDAAATLASVQPMMAALRDLEKAVGLHSGQTSPTRRGAAPSAGVEGGASSSSPRWADEKSAFSPGGSEPPRSSSSGAAAAAAAAGQHQQQQQIDGPLTAEMLLERMSRIEAENRSLRDQVSDVEREARIVRSSPPPPSENAGVLRNKAEEAAKESAFWRSEALRLEAERVHADALARRARAAEEDREAVRRVLEGDAPAKAAADGASEASGANSSSKAITCTWQRRQASPAENRSASSSSTTFAFPGRGGGSAAAPRSTSDDAMPSTTVLGADPSHVVQQRGRRLSSLEAGGAMEPVVNTPTRQSEPPAFENPRADASSSPHAPAAYRVPSSHQNVNPPAVPPPVKLPLKLPSSAPSPAATPPPAKLPLKLPGGSRPAERPDPSQMPAPPTQQRPAPDADPRSPSVPPPPPLDDEDGDDAAMPSPTTTNAGATAASSTAPAPRDDANAGGASAMDDATPAVAPRAVVPAKLPLKLPGAPAAKLPLKLPVKLPVPEQRYSTPAEVQEEEQQQQQQQQRQQREPVLRVAPKTQPDPALDDPEADTNDVGTETAAPTVPSGNAAKLPLKLPVGAGRPAPVTPTPFGEARAAFRAPPPRDPPVELAPRAAPAPAKLPLKLPGRPSPAVAAPPTPAPDEPNTEPEEAEEAEEEGAAEDETPVPVAVAPPKLPLKLPGAPVPAPAKLPLKLAGQPTPASADAMPTPRAVVAAPAKTPLKLPGAPPAKLPLKLPGGGGAVPAKLPMKLPLKLPVPSPQPQ